MDYEKPLMMLVGGLLVLGALHGGQMIKEMQNEKKELYSSPNMNESVESPRGVQIVNEDDRSYDVKLVLTPLDAENDTVLYRNSVNIGPGGTKTVKNVVSWKKQYELSVSTGSSSQVFDWKISEELGDAIVEIRDGEVHTRQEIL